MKVRVLGVGSPWGDDQAGWLVVDALWACGAEAMEGVTLLKTDRPGAALLAQWGDADHVIVVDAMQTGEAPGSIRHLTDGAWRAHGAGLSSHGFGVLEALTLADALGTLPARLDVYGIEVAGVGPAASPGPAVSEAARRLAASLLQILRGRGDPALKFAARRPQTSIREVEI